MTMNVGRRLGGVIGLTGLMLSSLPSGVAGAGLPLELVQSGYTMPVYVTNAGDSRLFVVEQGGLIKIVGGGVFLDLSGVVGHGDSEAGLYSMAFHPKYASNRLFYVYYARPLDGATVVAEYKRSGNDPDVADPDSGRVVLVIQQPHSFHNGGWIGFKGTKLYIASGDGGPGDWDTHRAQSLDTLLGKILRINPLDPDGNGPLTYSIPRKNPFVGRAGLDEIWSYGLRNPWRCSFDRRTGKLWCGDVGEGSWEEINRSRTGKGINFGWSLLEGRYYYAYPGRTYGLKCTSKCMRMPIASYPQIDAGPECGGSVTGGYVSRRTGAVMRGKYVFGDFCTGRVWIVPAKFKASHKLPEPVADTDFLIVSFGEGHNGRLYLVDYRGAVYRLTNS